MARNCPFNAIKSGQSHRQIAKRVGGEVGLPRWQELINGSKLPINHWPMSIFHFNEQWLTANG
jgi:hypothetical protein